MTNIMDKIYQEQSLSKSEGFIFNYYIKAINTRYDELFLTKEDGILIVEDFFNVRSGEISKLLSPQDTKILQNTYENLDGEKFKEFERGKLDFEDCCIDKVINSNSQEFSHFLKLHSQINTAFKEKLKDLDSAYEDFLEREKQCALALRLNANSTYSLKDKADELREYLQMCVFKDIPLINSCQEVIHNDFIFFKETLPELFAKKAKSELESLDYKIALFKDEKESQKEGYDCYVFAYAKDEEALKKAEKYFQENYTPNNLSLKENHKQSIKH